MGRFNRENRTDRSTRRLGPFCQSRRLATAMILVIMALALPRPALAAGACEYGPPWTATGDLITARAYHTATLLPNGKVLAVGAFPQTDREKTELYDPATGVWTATGNLSLQYGRYHHTATLLQNGKVLVAGGWGGPSGNTLTHAEFYDPNSGTWTATTPMNIARENHTGTLLADGRVLVIGGTTSGGIYPQAEIYNPGDGTWTLVTSSSLAARELHTATLLTSGAHAGKVLVAGGHKTPEGFLDTTVLFNPADLTFSATNKSLTHARGWHTATLLPNGLVLVAGGAVGYGYENTAEIINPEDTGAGFWPLTSNNLVTGRYCHTATLLPNGMVVVGGGENSVSFLNSFEIYDPVAGQWVIDCTFPDSRSKHTATLLPNGQVLIAGGYNGSYLNSAILWDPAAGSWGTTGILSHPRVHYTATLLPNGKVLAAGGDNNLPGTAEIFDPAANGGIGAWTPTGNLGGYRNRHTATLLANGKVLVAGGSNPDGQLSSAELFDPAANGGIGAWSTTGYLHTTRQDHTATLLANGKVLVAGGYNGSSVYLSSAELYDPADGTWTTTGSLHEARQEHTATLLPNGKVLVAGGLPLTYTAEVFDPGSGIWSYTANNMSTQHRLATATLLPNGKVLLVGAWYDSLDCSLYDPVNNTWTTTGDLISGRHMHTATLLPNGKVLAVGGYSGGGKTSAELYDPATGTWTTTDSLSGGRYQHRAVLLPDGRVLVAAGMPSYDEVLNTAQLFDPGLGFQASWQPVIDGLQTSLPATPDNILAKGEQLIVSGSGFRGLSEASGGATNNSSTGYPLVQLRRLDSEQTIWVPPSSGSFSDTTFSSAPFQWFPTGHCLVTVFTNGIPSESMFTLFNNTESPTAVELASFTAAWDKKRVVVEWETRTEKNNLGFYLWRTAAGQDAYTRLTQDLIPARGSASMGASYSYADYAVVRGREYLYKLEDVDRHGGSTFHGPVSAPAGGGKKSKNNRMK